MNMKKCSEKLDNLPIPKILFEDSVKSALKEDIGTGDVTTSALIHPDTWGSARIIAKEDGILAGLFVAMETFLQVDDTISFEEALSEGSFFKKGQELLVIKGRVSSMLLAERVALNFLQRLCGIATLTKEFVERIKDLNTRIVGTRKTTPGLKILEKYAIRIGGGCNHRMNLSDGILIKDNHIAAVGSIKDAVRRARNYSPHTLKVEIEVTDINDLKEAINKGADIVMLDNIKPEQIKKAVEVAKKIRKDVLLEASGGVTLENVREIAKTGVDIISVGALTHSFKSIDLSLKINILEPNVSNSR